MVQSFGFPVFYQQAVYGQFVRFNRNSFFIAKELCEIDVSQTDPPQPEQGSDTKMHIGPEYFMYYLRVHCSDYLISEDTFSCNHS